MYCSQCGAAISDNAIFCGFCGARQKYAQNDTQNDTKFDTQIDTLTNKQIVTDTDTQVDTQINTQVNTQNDTPYHATYDTAKNTQINTQNNTQFNTSNTTINSSGYSRRINDPAFAKYLKSANRWASVFSCIIAAIAIIGFYIAGEAGVDDMANPQALYIGFGIGGMFLVIALFQVLGRKGQRTWDGTVIDKTIKKKSRQTNTGNNESYIEYYTEYAVIIRAEDGKKLRLCAENDDTRFNYFQIGDKVRRHAGLNSYEKFDKSKDSIIFCNACGTLCDIGDDICHRCKCPLLK